MFSLKGVGFLPFDLINEVKNDGKHNDEIFKYARVRNH